MNDQEKVVGHIAPNGYGTLDPEVDSHRWERMVGRIMTAAAPELRRRSGTGGSWAPTLARWRRSGLLTAGLVAVAASVAILMLGQPSTEGPLAVLHPADALMPEMADWLMTGEAPTMLALYSEFGGGS